MSRLFLHSYRRRHATRWEWSLCDLCTGEHVVTVAGTTWEAALDAARTAKDRFNAADDTERRAVLRQLLADDQEFAAFGPGTATSGHL